MNNTGSWLGTGSEQDIMNIKTNLAGNNGAYEEMIVAFSAFQSRFISQLATKWACQDAIEFGGIFNDTFNRLLSDVNIMFVDFFNVIDQAGRDWATSLRTSYLPINFSPRTVKLDVSLFKENISGLRGIDKDQAQVVLNNLAGIKNEIMTSLSKAKTVIVNNPNFFGSSTTYLVQSMARIENRINAAVEEIVAATQNAINATIAHYENTAGRIAQAFAAQA